MLPYAKPIKSIFKIIFFCFLKSTKHASRWFRHRKGSFKLGCYQKYMAITLTSTSAHTWTSWIKLVHYRRIHVAIQCPRIHVTVHYKCNHVTVHYRPIHVTVH